MGEYYEKGDKRGPAIPYPKITGLLFNGPSNRTQSLIPFLGAGASLGRRPVWKEPDVVYPGADELERIISGLHLSGTARQFMELAVRLAAKIQALQQADQSGRARPNPLALAQDAKYPPSASELAAALAFQSQYDGFERPRQRLGAVLSADDEHLAALLRWIADLTEIGPSVPPLLSVASYYEYTLQRSSLWNDLKSIFANKRTPACAHWLIARAAEHFLSLNPRKDYLIVTTNYDCLMEIALERIGVPYCVLTVAASDQYVDTRFSPGMRDYLGLSQDEFALLKSEHARKYPRNFDLDLGRPVAIVYKPHGCLFPDEANRDSVVLSDEDYIRYLMRMYDNNGMIPSAITRLTESPAFLFLGYSFSDWNVRALYKAVVKQRTEAQRLEVKDFAVVREVCSYETAYCREGNGRIHMLVTDLARFAREILLAAPKRPVRRRSKKVSV